MRQRLLAGIVALATMAAVASAAADHVRPGPPFRADGRFIRDAAGRVRFFHGVNAVWKRAPYYPPSSVYPAPFAVPSSRSFFDERDAEFLAANGLSSVRLGVLWAGVEPRPGRIDRSYLDRIADLVRMLADRGVTVMLDFHQDMYNERFEGEGFPDWATQRTVPPTNCCGFPGNYFTPAVMHAFDRLWLNVGGLWDHYRGAWTAVARRFADAPTVLGYDLMNEPWPGTQWPTCANPLGCPAFQNLFLQPFFEHVIAGIRRAGGRGIAFVEPDVTNDFGAANTMGLLAPIADPAGNTGISFHAYCLLGGFVPGLSRSADPACPIQERLTFVQQRQASARNRSALFLTEFGASDELEDIARVAALADEHMVSWHYWHYGSWADPTGNPAAQGLFADDLDRPGSLKQAKADVLIRTYPQAVAGTPLGFRFEVGSPARTFRLTFLADPKVHAPTEIFVPVARHYRGGYRVRVSGPAEVTSPPGASLLTLRNTGAGRVTVVVTRA
jgi:endoglycosylceramidase